MKNKLIYDYVIDKRLPLLLGIKEEEIVEVEDYTKNIVFKRSGKRYKISLDMKDTGLRIILRTYPISYTMYAPSLIECIGVVNEWGFEKFRNLLTEQLREPVKFDCSDENSAVD